MLAEVSEIKYACKVHSLLISASLAEIFHVFVILAAAVHFVAVAQLVLSFEDGSKIA